MRGEVLALVALSTYISEDLESLRDERDIIRR